jgi:hypothetical protein
MRGMRGRMGKKEKEEKAGAITKGEMKEGYMMIKMKEEKYVDNFDQDI